MLQNMLQYLLFFLLLLPFCGLPFLLSFRRFLPLKKGRFYLPVILFFFGLTISMVIQIGDPVNVLGILPFYLFGVLVCFQGRLLEKLTFAAVFFPIPICTSVIADSLPLPFPFTSPALSRILAWAVLAPVIYLLSGKAPAAREPLKLPNKLLGLLLLLTLLPFLSTIAVISLTSYEYMDFLAAFGNQQQYRLYLAPVWIVLLFSLLSSLGLIVSASLFARQMRLQEEETLAGLRRLYYENLEKEQFQVRRLRHDMANHLQALSSLEGEAAAAYIRELLDSHALSQNFHFCDNAAANAILSAKQYDLQQAEIRARLEVHLPASLPVRDIDLCSILGNCLDNAVEACRKLSPEERQLSLHVTAEKGLFLLQCENPLPEPLNKDAEGKPRTTKADAKKHGIGLKNLSSIADSYGGYLEHTEAGGQFVLRLSFPLPACQTSPAPL